MRVSSGEFDAIEEAGLLSVKLSDASFGMASGAAFLRASLLRSCSKSLHLVVRISTVSLRSFFSVASRVILSLQASRSTLRFSFSKSSGFIARVALCLGRALEDGFGGGFIETLDGAIEVNGWNTCDDVPGAGKMEDIVGRGVIGLADGVADNEEGDPQVNIGGGTTNGATENIEEATEPVDADDNGGSREELQVKVGGGTNKGDTETCRDEVGG